MHSFLFFCAYAINKADRNHLFWEDHMNPARYKNGDILHN